MKSNADVRPVVIENKTSIHWGKITQVFDKAEVIEL